MINRARALMTSPAMDDVLSLALTGDPEQRLPGFRSKLEALHPRGDIDVSGVFQITYDLPSADNPTTEFLGVTTSDVEGEVATVAHGDMTLRVWRHPADPGLPGLAAAYDPTTVDTWVDDAPLTALETRAYRPLRRAVLLAMFGDHVTFIKVLPEKKAERLGQRVDMIHEAGIGPAVLARPVPGVLMIDRAAGHSLADAIVAWHTQPDQMPSPANLIELLDALPAEAVDLSSRPSWSDRFGFHLIGATDQLPDQADRLNRLAERLQHHIDTADIGPIVPTHGDFYEANIFVEDGRATGMIDVDSLGPGRRVDDLACALAHLAVLPDLSPAHYPRVDELVQIWLDDFSTRVDPVALRARTAAVIVSLISGAPHDQAMARLAVAERFADLADAAAA